MTAMAVRTQARNVRSFAQWSPNLLIISHNGNGSSEPGRAIVDRFEVHRGEAAHCDYLNCSGSIRIG